MSMFSQFIFSRVELPPLNGSEKQVAWAADIRGDLLRSIDNRFSSARDIIRRDLDAGKLTGARADEMRAMFHAAWASLAAKDDAKWWIDHRNDTDKMLIAAAK